MASVFSDWPRRAAGEFGRKPLVLRHRLAESPLFSDAALTRLIEAAPRSHYHVNTMARDALDPHLWREGEIDGLSGQEVLAAVAGGRLWLHIQRVQEIDPAYADVLDAAFDELEARMPGWRAFKRSMSVLVSSPRMNVAYHSDVPGQSLWQVRGRKRVWIYPARPPFLPRKAAEDIALRRNLDTDLPYASSFDAYAESYVLEPGEMASWPRACPHRVVNEDCVNVSFATEHWTKELLDDYAVDYANGLLRPWSGGRDLSRATQGPAFLAKFALAGAHKLLRRLRPRELPSTVDFRVAPRAESGFVDIAPRRLAK